jgi:hypothetical protein
MCRDYLYPTSSSHFQPAVYKEKYTIITLPLKKYNTHVTANEYLQNSPNLIHRAMYFREN